MRVGVVGLGSAGRRHIWNLLALGCDVSVSDVSEAALQRVHVEYPAARVLVTLIPLFLSELDALVIATPWDQHLVWTEAAITWHVPVFIEKPLGSIKQLPRWRELAALERLLPITQVGYQCRFHPKAQALKALFKNPFGGEFVCDVNMAEWPGTTYGPLLLEASHEADLMLWFGAPPVTAAQALGDTQYPYCLPLYGQSGLCVKFGDDWVLYLRDNATRYYRQWRLLEDGDYGGGASVTFRSPVALGDQMYRDELAHFLECVRDRKPTICPLADGLRVLEVCAVVEQMARQTV